MITTRRAVPAVPMLATPALVHPALAQERPVRFIVPFPPPGGPTDLVGRVAASPEAQARFLAMGGGTHRQHAGSLFALRPRGIRTVWATHS